MKWSLTVFGIAMIGWLSVSAQTETAADSLAGNTLTAFLERAQVANPGLEAFSLRYEAAMERIPQARALPDPMFQVTHFVESVQTRMGPQENAFVLSQRLPWFGKLSGREAVASAEAEALWFAWQRQQLQLAREVATAFYEYAYASEALSVTRENLGLSENLLPVVESRVQGGTDLNPLLELKLEIARLNDQISALEEQRRRTAVQLAGLLALPLDAIPAQVNWEAPEAASFNEDELLLTLEANNPELQMLERRIGSAEARHELARLDSWPDVTLGLNYIQIGDTGMGGQDAGRDAWGVTVGVSIPLWFDRNRAARSEALFNQRAAEREKQNRYNQLRAQLQSALSQLEDARRRMQLYGEELQDLAEQAAVNSRSSYESGRASVTDMIDRERDLLDLKLSYWRAAAIVWQQRVTLQTLTNQPLGSSSGEPLDK